MRARYVILAAAALALNLCGVARAAFTDNFSGYQSGADGTPTWRPFLGQWTVQDGEYRQTGAEEYDQGASVGEKPTGRYTISVRTRSLGGAAGGGLFWNMQSRDTRANSQMVRVDPSFVIWGYEDANGDFQLSGISPTSGVTANTWHTLAVAVDTDLGKYNVLLDGKIIGRNANLRFFNGFAGIQSSLANAFDDFEIRSATPAELDGLAITTPFDAPQAVAVGPDGNIYVADRGHGISTVSGKTGRVLGSSGGYRNNADGLMDPVAITFHGDRMYVLDRQRMRITVLKGERAAAARNAGNGAAEQTATQYTLDRHINIAPLDDASGLAALPDGSLVLVSPGRNEVSVLDGTGKQLASYKTGLKQPQGVMVDSAGRILVADTGNQRIVPMTFGADRTLTVGKEIPGWLNPTSLAVNSRGNLVHLGSLGYYENGGAVREVDQTGRRVAHFAGFSVGAIGKAGGIALGPDDTVYVADTDNNRIVVIPPDFSEPRPHVEPKGSEAVITWSAHPDTARTALRYGKANTPDSWAGAGALREPDAETPANRRRRMKLGNLAPNTTYYYRFSSPIRTIPATEWTKTYSFLSAPPRGQMQYVTIRAIVAIYLKTDNKGQKFAMDRAKLGDRIPRMMARGREFYWRNTHFKVNLDLDYTVIEDAEADIRESIPPLEQVKKDIQASGDFRGKKVGDYDSVFALWVSPNYSADQPEAVGQVGGGGLTPYGYSAFNADGTIAWLTVHEFNHQMDAYFERAGYPEYWLNHPDATIHPGRYGQQFDANAFIFRNWPVNDWFWLPANGVGRIDLTTDVDGDGVPDNDARLALDEAKLGSSPMKWDTDGDGLSDLEEAMAGIFGSSNPRVADTDKDGVKDPRDPWPLNPERQDRPRKTPVIDGVISPGEWTELSTLTGPYTGKTYLNWDESAVYVAAVLDAPATMEVDLDPGNDGIFTGNDIMLRAGAMQPMPSPMSPPAPLPIASGQGAYGMYHSHGGKTVVEIAIPQNPAIGLMPAPEQTMGLAIRLMDGKERWMSVFEPWRLWTFNTIQ